MRLSHWLAQIYPFHKVQFVTCHNDQVTGHLLCMSVTKNRICSVSPLYVVQSSVTVPNGIT